RRERSRSLRRHAATEQCFGEGVLPAAKRVTGGGLRGRVVHAIESRGRDDASGAEVSVVEHLTPELLDRVQRRERAIGVDCPAVATADELPRPPGGLLDQLRLATGEVVVDRAARGA